MKRPGEQGAELRGPSGGFRGQEPPTPNKNRPPPTSTSATADVKTVDNRCPLIVQRDGDVTDESLQL